MKKLKVRDGRLLPKDTTVSIWLQSLPSLHFIPLPLITLDPLNNPTCWWLSLLFSRWRDCVAPGTTLSLERGLLGLYQSGSYQRKRTSKMFQWIGLCNCGVWLGRSEMRRAGWQAGNSQATDDVAVLKISFSSGKPVVSLRPIFIIKDNRLKANLL